MVNEQARVNILVIGKVQGVFYRASTLEQAQRLNLTGWVKNLPDGAVEITAEGSRIGLEDLVVWCRQGPPDAKVDEVIPRWGKFENEFRTFMIIR
jgi:acylphosphatase